MSFLNICLGFVLFADPVDFYVSPDGLDKNPGTLDKPFATLAKARDAVRSMKRSKGLPPDGVTVWLRGGEYPLSGPLTLNSADSGEPDKPVIYSAYEDEVPVLSGGRCIKGLRPGRGGIWKTSVPESKNGSWIFRTLYVNGSRYALARSPNNGFYEMEGALPDENSPKEGTEAGKSKAGFKVLPSGIAERSPSLLSSSILELISISE